jgi:YHS domain-containing protein
MKIYTMFALVLALSASAQAQAQPDPAQRQKQYNLEKGVAITGYDPVAYFTQKKAVKGSIANSVNNKGITYHFSSAANKELFLKSPDKYEPAYGGWCAYAMGATGEKVEIDPETFEVREGKLYLFYNRFFTNTLPKWQKDETNLQRRADQSWMKFNSSKS